MDPHSSKPRGSRVSCIYLKLWHDIPVKESTTATLAITQLMDGGHREHRCHEHPPTCLPCTGTAPAGRQPSGGLAWTISCHCFTFPRTMPSNRAATIHPQQLLCTRHVATVSGELQFPLYLIFKISKLNQRKAFFFPIKFNFISVRQTHNCSLITAWPKILSLYRRVHARHMEHVHCYRSATCACF